MTNRANQTIPAPREPHNRLFGTEPFALNISRVIGGQKFDTTTATLACVIACCGTSLLADFRFERTGLYLSPRGQFFVAGEGGACSRWGCRAIDGSRVPGDGVESVSDDQARRLLEQHGGQVKAFFECGEG